jgi:hypothetical protein
LTVSGQALLLATMILRLLLCFFLFIAALPARGQDSTDTPQALADSILEEGMDQIISFLLLSRGDFTFRDDYTEKDVYRLPVIDSLMKHPLSLKIFADSLLAIMAKTPQESEQPFSILESLSKGGSVESETPIAISESFDKNLLQITEMTTPAWSELSSDKRQFILTKFKEMIIEDPEFKDRPVEYIDSVQDAEEQYAIELAEFAKEIEPPSLDPLRRALLMAFNLRKEKDGKSRAWKNLRKRGKAISDIRRSGKVIDRVVFGTPGNDVFQGEFAVIIDPGGDDSYYLSYDIEHPHGTIIIDLGGDDYYKAETDFALASGTFSYSLLLDFDGDDVYRGQSFTLGAGFFGAGLLWDLAGNDSYFGDTFTEGAGTFGYGLLIDSEGNDIYTGNLYAQGFGFVRGVGGVVDHDGNDSYIIQPKYQEFFHPGQHYLSLSQGFGYGIRPYLSGGFGFICDFAGNDSYVADFFTQGASYWWSLGMIADGAGNDQYLSYQYAQGSGAHMTLGLLYDVSGDDVYRSHGVAQGCGHDYSCGWLLDKTGDDVYSSYGLSQGAGQANGIGIFTDVLGQDGYYIFNTADCQGYGNPRRDYGSIGIFLDLDGDDRYDGNGGNNLFWEIPSRWGAGLDQESIGQERGKGQ